MKTFTYLVTIECEDQDQAEKVIGERLGFDEDYGFNYTLDFEQKSEMSDEQAQAFGRRLVVVLDIRPAHKGSPDSEPTYATTWGNKTTLGLGRTVLRLVKEETE